MKIIFSIIIVTSALNIFSQSNLILNPSFEDTANCPFFLGFLNPILNWENFGNTPDCFNSCSDMTINMPNSDFGFQYAHSGNSMVGLVSYVWEQCPGWPNYREYIGTELASSLNIGEKYYVSFYINCAGYSPGLQHIGTNKMGVKFTNYKFDTLSPPNPDNFSHIHEDSILVDTVGWYKFQGSFVADSAYKYLVIGNFYDEIQTDTLIFGGGPFGGSAGYYYIDDVCVSTDSSFCENWLGLPENILFNENKILVFPNPTTDVIFINSDKPIYFYEVYDYVGELMESKKENEGLKKIDLSSFDNGIYFIKLYFLEFYYYTKIQINKSN